MRTDTIFYQLFQTFPSLVFELIGADSSQASSYEFSSREIKELAGRFDGMGAFQLCIGHGIAVS